jgi:hypothetical protein
MEGRERETGLDCAFRHISRALECAETDAETAASLLRAAARYLTRDRLVTSGNVITVPLERVTGSAVYGSSRARPRAASRGGDAGDARNLESC